MLGAAQEFAAEGYESSSLPRSDESFQAYVERLRGYETGAGLQAAQVPSTELWLLDGGEFIGRTSIRHHLTDDLLLEGGHIGYAIRPSRRRLGYGRRILELALDEARPLGLRRVLLTCDAGNLASRRIIERHGGELDPALPGELLHFWIALK